MKGPGESTVRKFVPHSDEAITGPARFFNNTSTTEVWGRNGSPEAVRKSLIVLLEGFSKLQERYESDPNPSGWLEERIVFLGCELNKMVGRAEMDLYGTARDTKEYLAQVTENKIDHQTLLALAERHSRHMASREQILQPLVEKAKLEFIEKVKEEVDEGLFPKEVLARLPRIRQKTVLLADRLNNPSSNTSAHTGTITVARIYSDTLDDPAEVRHTLFHEFLHEISGRAFHVKEEIGADKSRTVIPTQTKEGVSLPSTDSSKPRFTWLNEAITEHLALLLSGYDDGDDGEGGSFNGSRSYMRERKILQQMLENGLEEKVLASGYFEDFVDTAGKTKMGAHFATLMQAVRTNLKEPSAINRIENEFLFNSELRPFFKQNFIDGDLITSIDQLRTKVPPGTGLYKITVDFGHRGAQVQSVFYKAMSSDFYDERGGSDREITTYYNKELGARTRDYQSRLKWTIEPLGRTQA